MSKVIIGLSGGIGSGKTAVSDRFAEKGIDVIDADVIARVVVEPGTEALTKIREHFGDGILDSDGQLRRAELRKRIFSNPDEKQWLEALLHPLIAEETLRQLGNIQSAYGLYVSPLLVEGGQKALCDRLLVVDVPEDIQIERIMARDHTNKVDAIRILQSQASRQKRLDAADDVIVNDESLDVLRQRVLDLHMFYQQLARQKQGENANVVWLSPSAPRAENKDP